MYATINPVAIFPGEAEIIYCADLRIRNIGNAATAEVVWELQSSSKQMLKSGVLYMNNTDYNNWGAENSYIFDWIANQLGLTIVDYIEDQPLSVNTQITDSVTAVTDTVNDQITDSVTQ